MREFILVICLLFAVPVQAGTLASVLSWTNPDTTDGIQIEKASSCAGAFTVLKSVPAGTTSYTDATNAPGDTPCYRVAYVNSSGIGPYAGPTGKVFPPIPAQAPTSLQVQ